MDELTPKERAKLEKAAKLMEFDATDADLALQSAIDDSIEEVKTELIESQKELASVMLGKFDEINENLKKKLESELVLEIDKEELRGEPGEPGKDGKDYVLTASDKKEIASGILIPVIEKVIEKTEIVREIPIVTNEIREVAVLNPNDLPQYGDKFRDGLEILTGEDRLDRDAIRGLDDYDEVARLAKEPKIEKIYMGGGNGSGSTGSYVPYTGATGNVDLGANDLNANKVTVTKTSLGTTATDAILAQNTTSATSGNQQVSPSITRTGQGYKSQSVAGSQPVSFRDFVSPVQGGSEAGLIFKNQFSVNGGTWTDAFWYDQSPGGAGFSIYTPAGQSNGTPGTTRLVSLNNSGQNTWIDNIFSGTRKSSWGADSQGQMFADSTSNNGLVVRVNGTAYHYLGNAALLTYGYGGFQTGINAGSTNANSSTLQSSGGTALKVKLVTVDTTLDNSATKWIADGTGNSSCAGTPTYDCSHWSNQTECELRDAHGGCTWNAGSDCSAFSNEFGMGSCLANSPCSASSTSCVGPTDEASCLAQDDTYGGSCAFNPDTTADCSAFNSDPTTCGSTSGCTANYSDCSAFSDGGGEGGACMATPGCSYDSGSGVCSGTYFSSCSGTYVVTPANCSGTYYTGACTGTYGASCSGTSSCSGITGSTDCSGEAGCSYVTRINLYLPDLTTCPDRDYFIIDGASGGEDVIVHPYSGQTIDMTSSYTISNYKDGIHISPYNDTRSCASLAETPCGTTTGCTQNYSNCAWDAGGNVCNGGIGCSGYSDEGSCNAATYFSSCAGSYVVSRNWYVWSRT